MAANTSTKQSFWSRRRTWIILAGIVLFLPPLSLLFQMTADTNFCGSWCPRMFFTWRNGMSLNEFLMGFLRSYMGVALVAGILVSTFFLGRAWCSHICPIGGTMELGSRIVPRRLRIDFSGISASPFRYGYLAVYFIASAVGLGSLCCNYCNFATVPRIFGAAFLDADLMYFLRTAGLINLGLVVVLGFLAIKLCDLYWVATPMRRMPEFTQFDNTKSIIRNFPAMGTAGLARQSVSWCKRLPLPPANIMA